MPTEVKNLTVLPKDMSPADVMKIMKAWNAALNVQCVFCHVGQVGKPLATVDFASDNKKRKDVSRVMVKMVMQANESLQDRNRGRPAAGPVLDVPQAVASRGRRSARDAAERTNTNKRRVRRPPARPGGRQPSRSSSIPTDEDHDKDADRPDGPRPRRALRGRGRHRRASCQHPVDRDARTEPRTSDTAARDRNGRRLPLVDRAAAVTPRRPERRRDAAADGHLWEARHHRRGRRAGRSGGGRGGQRGRSAQYPRRAHLGGHDPARRRAGSGGGGTCGRAAAARACAGPGRSPSWAARSRTPYARCRRRASS